MKITILSENTALARDIRGEHGLAFWIDTGEHCLLFDTGQGLVLTENAQALHVDLDAVDTIVLSHGHYDHTGGLVAALRQAAGTVTVHAHPDALLPKYYRDKTNVRETGMSAETRAAIVSDRCRFVPSRQSVEVAPGIRTTGEIPRRHPEETITEPFCRDPQGRDPDLLLEDQALFMESPRGTVVLLGCAHAGIVNTLDQVQRLTSNKPVHAVIGGTHLRSASAERIAWTIRELRRFNLNLLAPLHCTGQKSFAALWSAFPNICQAGGAGTVFEF
jgi:7,8-dihydropterin-6-yl-methyl-4-(beta-D-ribofuranosyl)aminobenzene 5'-phosphate synthase